MRVLDSGVAQDNAKEVYEEAQKVVRLGLVLVVYSPTDKKLDESKTSPFDVRKHKKSPLNHP